jgi:hypothetical protein
VSADKIMSAFLSEVGSFSCGRVTPYFGVMERLLLEHDEFFKSVELKWLDSDRVDFVARVGGHVRVFKVKGDRVGSLGDKNHEQFEETWGWFVEEVLGDLRDVRAMAGFKFFSDGGFSYVLRGGEIYGSLVGKTVVLRGGGCERDGWRAFFDETGEVSELEMRGVRANGFVGALGGGDFVFVRGSEILGFI